MTRGQRRSLVRRLHSGVGWLLAGLLVVVAASGILLQHPQWLGSETNAPLCVAADPADPGHLLRGTHWGVEASGDRGHQWREVNMLSAPTDVSRILFVGSGASAPAIYALGRDGLVVSVDGGRVWSEIRLPSAESLAGALPLDLAVGPGGKIILLTTGGTFERPPDGSWRSVGEPFEVGRDWHHWVHDLHTGQLAGVAGRRVGEGVAWGLLLLVLSGLVLQQRVRRRNHS